jgi:hypothetical protein
MEMATRKYEHLVKPLSTGSLKRNAPDKKGAYVTGPGSASQKVWLNGRDHLEGLNLNFTWGLHNSIGDWHDSREPHVHPYPECHMYLGLDTANVNYMGAEIECCLGEERETYTFNEPTVVVVPAGLPHGPTVTKRVYSPKGFGFYLAALNSTTETEWLERGGKPAKSTGKYAHLVKSLRAGLLTERKKLNVSRFTPEQLAEREEKLRKNGQLMGPGNADHLTWMYSRDLEDLNVNLLWGFYSSPGIWHRGVGAHVHPVDEVLVYAGTDPNNIDYLGAEIEMDMGKEHERYIINKPTVVICPAGIPHNPQVTRWVDRPFAFFAINLSGEHETRSFD